MTSFLPHHCQTTMLRNNYGTWEVQAWQAYMIMVSVKIIIIIRIKEEYDTKKAVSFMIAEKVLRGKKIKIKIRAASRTMRIQIITIVMSMFASHVA